jgi:hypothetical protein
MAIRQQERLCFRELRKTQAEVERLRAALQEIRMSALSDDNWTKHIADVADEALKHE